MRKLSLALLGLFLAALLATGAPVLADETLEATLKASATSGDVPAELVIVYDDMHGLHGGSTIELKGDGTATRRDVNRGAEATASATVAAGDLHELVKLLVEVEAWTQKTPSRELVPDESQARLVLKLGEQELGFWEFYNDMEANQRLSKVKARLDTLVAAGTP